MNTNGRPVSPEEIAKNNAAELALRLKIHEVVKDEPLHTVLAATLGVVYGAVMQMGSTKKQFLQLIQMTWDQVVAAQPKKPQIIMPSGAQPEHSREPRAHLFDPSCHKTVSEEPK